VISASRCDVWAWGEDIRRLDSSVVFNAAAWRRRLTGLLLVGVIITVDFPKSASNALT
jgi:hypothetical protein